MNRPECLYMAARRRLTRRRSVRTNPPWSADKKNINRQSYSIPCVRRVPSFFYVPSISRAERRESRFVSRRTGSLMRHTDGLRVRRLLRTEVVSTTSVTSRRRRYSAPRCDYSDRRTCVVI
ncbi:hypothetical protein EVAR_25684_1 [Eumeta japonica]|uniref:Uncharacterized protein n=1 Tax=Eumeta variegata TaxID=151549 RepID=A0A4C1WF51_EUMVA|nr:hypothetical protein EVAR_25684_1 [Eumeta japonica]